MVLADANNENIGPVETIKEEPQEITKEEIQEMPKIEESFQIIEETNESSMSTTDEMTSNKLSVMDIILGIAIGLIVYIIVKSIIKKIKKK